MVMATYSFLKSEENFGAVVYLWSHWDNFQVLVKELAESPGAYATAGTTVVAVAAIGSTFAAVTIRVLDREG